MSLFDDECTILKSSAFLHWAGGKKTLVNTILEKTPISINNYHEPFLGGGSIYFAINHRVKNTSYLSDIGYWIINAYNCIKYNLEEVLELLKVLQLQQNESDFYRIRKEFNLNINERLSTEIMIRQCAYFIYMNRTCFNGLYRVNKKGESNSSFGIPKRIDENQIISASIALKNNTVIRCLDYKESLLNIQEGDVVYLDPPYIPVTKTEHIIYNNNFSMKDQFELRDIFFHIKSKGATVLLSNSYCDAIFNLYKDANIDIVQENRSLNRNVNDRHKIKCVLIS